MHKSYRFHGLINQLRKAYQKFHGVKFRCQDAPGSSVFESRSFTQRLTQWKNLVNGWLMVNNDDDSWWLIWLIFDDIPRDSDFSMDDIHFSQNNLPEDDLGVSLNGGTPKIHGLYGKIPLEWIIRSTSILGNLHFPWNHHYMELSETGAEFPKLSRFLLRGEWYRLGYPKI